MRKVSIYVLWVLVVVYAVVKLLNQALPLHVPIALVVLIPAVFGLLHGALRYKWSGIVTFLVTCLVVSNLLENASIMTGFPFGHYHYTDVLGPKLLLVPLLIGPAYFATGYLAWVMGTVLIADISRTSNTFTTLAVPFIAAFAMVAWDLGLDPTASTINHVWIWEQGGGYFGCHSPTSWAGSSRCTCSSNCSPSSCVCAGPTAGRRRRPFLAGSTLRPSSCTP